jgi:hypothetical protein
VRFSECCHSPVSLVHSRTKPLAVHSGAEFWSGFLGASYVGNAGHHQLDLTENNPGNPTLYLSLSQPSQITPGGVTCGPFGEDTTYTRASGQVVNGTRSPLGPNFGSNANQAVLYLQQVARSLFQSGEAINPLNYALATL